MQVRCYAEFDLKTSEAVTFEPQPNRDDLVNWLKLLPIRASIRVDYGTRTKLVAYWMEER